MELEQDRAVVRARGRAVAEKKKGAEKRVCDRWLEDSKGKMQPLFCLVVIKSAPLLGASGGEVLAHAIAIAIAIVVCSRMGKAAQSR